MGSIVYGLLVVDIRGLRGLIVSMAVYCQMVSGVQQPDRFRTDRPDQGPGPEPFQMHYLDRWRMGEARYTPIELATETNDQGSLHNGPFR